MQTFAIRSASRNELCQLFCIDTAHNTTDRREPTNMPYYPKTHPRYRTKDEIAQDVSFALKSKLSPAAKYAVVKDAMWTWTELEGKYEGCQYWTPLAFALHDANRKANKKPGDGLRHEHIVPETVV